MGYGDYLMALGDASRLHADDPSQGPIAIGDGQSIDDPYPELRWGLDFVASQNDVASAIARRWVISHRGNRPYHDYQAMRRLWEARHPWRHRLLPPVASAKLVRHLGHYLFNSGYRPTPAPLPLTQDEQAIAAHWSARRFVVIEPSVKQGASPSKRWPFERYAELAAALQQEITVYQAGAEDSPKLDGVQRLPTARFRDVLPYLQAAQLYIGPEGGLHHASAAMGTPAVVIYGAYVPPSVTGYDFHVNLTGGATACGSQMTECAHCVDAMHRISVAEVLREARQLLAGPRRCSER